MGEQVATLYNDPKSAMVRSTVAAGALVPGANELVAWAGSTAVNQTEVFTALGQCMDHLRERDVPVAAAVTGARVLVGTGEAQVVFFEGVATPALTEAEVSVFYNQGFAFGFGASTELWDGMFKRAREKLFEEFYKLR
jgi:hypothetical protein